MAQPGPKGRSKSPGTAARRALAIPLLAKGANVAQVAQALDVSERTVVRWQNHPDVIKALGRVEERVIRTTEDRAAELVTCAWDTLDEIMRSADDAKARVEAAKTTLSRLGVPERKETSGELDIRTQALHVVFRDAIECEQWAAGEETDDTPTDE